ncbi:uncharacterized protein BDZ83DRAFT_753764 [Colletotrichum acutatum]|uniref:Uncharacterized protein n=1 Tax=Glomerella acutata TaxID=27357 RepID=A0AAD8UKQ5_GLOAC|nr:uncharacterized protein BDZ83DRAFT_753764 [Colletotrichum acutatum]KAK1723131.1 hypothetical protein BDZ83DRAFT_753764 [Colletotrichum acutatum]
MNGGAGGAIGRRTNSLKTTGSPQKKLTPPPQLRERNLLKSGSVSVSSSLSSVTGSVTRERDLEGHLGHLGAHPYHRQSSTSTSQQQQQPQHQHHTSTSTTTQQIRVHLRGGGGSAGQHHQQYQPVQPYQYQVPGQRGGPPPAPTSGAASRSRDTIANYNRLRRETQHSSTSTLHHQNYWPDNFRNPRGGLGIEHNNNNNNTTTTRSNSTATNPRNDTQPRTAGIQKLALEESGVAEE